MDSDSFGSGSARLGLRARARARTTLLPRLDEFFERTVVGGFGLGGETTGGELLHREVILQAFAAHAMARAAGVGARAALSILLPIWAIWGHKFNLYPHCLQTEPYQRRSRLHDRAHRHRHQNGVYQIRPKEIRFS